MSGKNSMRNVRTCLGRAVGGRAGSKAPACAVRRCLVRYLPRPARAGEGHAGRSWGRGVGNIHNVFRDGWRATMPRWRGDGGSVVALPRRHPGGLFGFWFLRRAPVRPFGERRLFVPLAATVFFGHIPLLAIPIVFFVHIKLNTAQLTVCFCKLRLQRLFFAQNFFLGSSMRGLTVHVVSSWATQM